MSLDEDDHCDFNKHALDFERIPYELPEFEGEEGLVLIHISEVFFIVNGCNELRVSSVSNQPHNILPQSLGLEEMVVELR